MKTRFKEARKMLGLSQAEFAKKFGSTQKAASFWDTGERIPRYETLIEIADACNVSTDWLLGRTSVSAFYPDGNAPTSEEVKADTQIAMDEIKEEQQKHSLPSTQEELNATIEAAVRKLLAERGL